MMACCRITPVFGLVLPGKRDSFELAGIKGQKNTKTRLVNREKEYWLGVQAELITHRVNTNNYGPWLKTGIR